MVLGRNYAKWQILDIGLGRKPKMGNGNSKFPKLNGFLPMHSLQNTIHIIRRVYFMKKKHLGIGCFVRK